MAGQEERRFRRIISLTVGRIATVLPHPHCYGAKDRSARMPERRRGCLRNTNQVAEAYGRRDGKQPSCGRLLTNASETIIAPCQRRNNRTSRAPRTVAARRSEFLGNL
jgi:hypothetical protein